MTSRERYLAAINHEPVDRVPTDIWATDETRQKIIDHFGSWEQAEEALHIDGLGWVGPRYIGPPLPEVPAGEMVDMWGVRSRAVEYDGGWYMEQYCDPLAQAKTIDDLESYNWPDPDWFDYSKIRESALEQRETHAVQCGYMAPLLNHNRLRGLEQSLMDPLIEPDFTHHLLERVHAFDYEYHRRMFEACDGLADVAQVTDDLGSQTGPLISLDVYREFYAPLHKEYIDLCRESGLKVFHHDDGSNRLFLPDLVEMGIDILNPIQWRCPGMDMAELKQEYGDRICFHGAVDNQETLPFGSPEDVRAEVRRCIDTLASDGTGYILAPCHNLQVITPIENIIAMYDEAWEYGKF